jgi:hypothetical protein
MAPTDKERGMKPLRFARALGLATALAVLSAAKARHITPVVELVKQVTVIRQTLPGATQFFVRDVTIGKEDLQKIKQLGDYVPDDPDVRFFVGKNAQGGLVGVVLFPQANTSQHGPIELGVTIGADGKVARAVVTKATVETKPWVEDVIKSGFLQSFEGVPAGTPVDRASKIGQARLSSMPAYMGEVINHGVNEGLVLYHVLYTPN